MPNNIIKSFSNKSGKSETEVEKIWNELKKEYKNDYEKITGTLKKILNIDEVILRDNAVLSPKNKHDKFRPLERHLIYKTNKYKLYDINKYIILTDTDDNQLFYIKLERKEYKTITLGARENLSNTPNLFFKVIYTLLYLGYIIIEDWQHNDLSIKSIQKLIKANIIKVKYDNKDITKELIDNNFNNDDINKTFSYELKDKNKSYLLENNSMFENDDLFELSNKLIKNTILNIDEASKGTYVARKVKNAESLYNHYKNQGVNVIPIEELHCTIAYSKKEFKPELNSNEIEIMYDEDIYPYLEPLGNDGCIVMKFKSKEMTERWQDCIDRGATYDYESYIPHITIAIDEKDLDLKSIRKPDFNIVLNDEYTEELDLNWKDKLTVNEEDALNEIAEEVYEEDNKELNKPFRTQDGPKKFGVYVKNDKGNVILVRFGDKNMEIKRDDPERRKSFRARHDCENKNDKTTLGYWSCKFWSSKSVNDLLESTSIKSIKEKFKDYFKKINIYEYDNKVSIDLIISNEKNSGYGTKLMNEIIDYCDKSNKTIILTPSDEFGGNKKRLIEFYKRFGFLENKGKNKIFGIFESMYRLPKNKTNEGLNMEVKEIVESLSELKLNFVTKAMITENVEVLDESKLNEYLESFEEYKNSVMESEKFASLVEGKDVDSLTEKEIEDLIEACSKEIEEEDDEDDDEDDEDDEDKEQEDLDENYIAKAMIEVSKGNKGSAIEMFKNAMLNTLSKNETYKEIDSKMSLYSN